MLRLQFNFNVHKNFQSSKIIIFQSNNQKELFTILHGNSTIIQMLFGGHLEYLAMLL